MDDKHLRKINKGRKNYNLQRGLNRGDQGYLKPIRRKNKQ